MFKLFSRVSLCVRCLCFPMAFLVVPIGVACCPMVFVMGFVCVPKEFLCLPMVSLWLSYVLGMNCMLLSTYRCVSLHVKKRKVAYGSVGSMSWGPMVSVAYEICQ